MDKYQQLRDALAERSTMRGLDPESLCGFNGKQVLLADIRDLLAEREALRDALLDMLAGWKYIRATHGDLYGVGWDRAQAKAEAALAKAIGEGS